MSLPDSRSVQAEEHAERPHFPRFPLVERLEQRQLLCSFIHGLEAPHTPALDEAPAPQFAAVNGNRTGRGVPGALKANVRKEGVIRLTWDDRSKGERGFRIERSTDGKEFERIGRAGRNAEAWADKKAPDDSPLFYRVRSLRGRGVSAPSNVVQVTGHVPEQPTGARLSSTITSINWSSRASNPITRFESNSAAVGGKFYVFGGYYNSNIHATSQSHVYDPVKNTWTGLPNMPLELNHSGVAVDGDTIWMAGGYVGDWQGYITRKVLKFDTSTRTWSEGPSLPDERGAGALVRVGRNLHFFGGVDGSFTNDKGDHWVLNLDAQEKGWRSAASMPNPRNHFGYAELNGKIYAIGGQRGLNEAGGNFRDVHRYDPATGKWSAVAFLPKVRSHTHTSTVVLNGKILAVGGVTNGSSQPTHLADVTQYDPNTNAWSALTPLPKTLEATSAVVIDGKIYTTGGAVYDAQLTTSAYVGTPNISTASPSPTTGATYQAENATRVGVRVFSNYPGYTGSGFADYTNASNDYIEWSASTSTARTYTLEFRYALGSSDRPLKLTVNGTTVKSSLSFPGTGSWSTWKTVSVSVPLKSGVNKIRLTAIGKSGGNIDRLVVK